MLRLNDFESDILRVDFEHVAAFGHAPGPSLLAASTVQRLHTYQPIKHNKIQ